MKAVENIRRNLLIVDDEVEITKSLQRQFRKDYTLYLATNTDEAYEIMSNNEIHVIISDQRMPKMTGVEFFSKIKNEFPETIRIILTGYADIDAVVKAINEGNIFRYISKPWNPVELETIINEAFEKHFLIVNNKILVKQLKESNDMLEQRVAERTKELVEVNEKLNKLNATKDKFFSIIAHDLRSPFNVIIGFSSLLSRSLPDTSSQTTLTAVKCIQESAKKASQLIDNLLLWAQTQKDSFEFMPEYFDLNLLVKENVELVKLLAKRKNIIIEAEYEKKAEVFADINMVRTILRNILTNAVKFSFPGGIIKLSVNQSIVETEVSISDTGIGMTELTLGKLFRIDSNLRTRGTAKETGTGLGLILCKEMVDKHGGRIWAKSKLNAGSTFYFTIPQKH